jgi:hypothetical protein
VSERRAVPTLHGDVPIRPTPLAGVQPTPPSHRRDPGSYVRYTLIEFIWDVAGGVQPVILRSRRLLD